MKSRLESFLNANKFFYKAQYGFKKDKDAHCAVFDLINNIQSALDGNKLAAAICVDLKKAFDTVDHQILLSKLHRIGVRGHIHEWFKSYLSNRPQLVKLNGIESLIEVIKCGIPQGSILGPLLFLIYINDMGLLRLNGNLLLFADDAALIYTATDPHQLEADMLQDLALLNSWFMANKLSLNVLKTNYIIFTKPSAPMPQLSLLIGSTPIVRVDYVKYLGVVLDKHLQWTEHVDALLPKLRSAANLIFRLRKTLDVKYLKMIYYAYYHSKLSYMSSIWGLANKQLISKISIFQNSVIKNVLGVRRRFSTQQIYWRTNILPFSAIVQVNLLLLVYNHIHSRKEFNSSIVFNNQIHNYNTRIAADFHVPKVTSTHYGLWGATYQALKLYNSLPPDLKAVSSYVLFKKRVKAFCFNKFVHD